MELYKFQEELKKLQSNVESSHKNYQIAKEDAKISEEQLSVFKAEYEKAKSLLLKQRLEVAEHQKKLDQLNGTISTLR